MLNYSPYLIIPNFIPQPTWGGSYITGLKNWIHLPELKNVRIGQSYELAGNVGITEAVKDSSSGELFPLINGKVSNGREGKLIIFFGNLKEKDKQDILGPEIYRRYNTIPILIKFTQALGNSFQLHRKPANPDPKWLPKAESWYFFEKGKITFGINPKTSVQTYRNACEKVDSFMKSLSIQIKSGKLSVEEGRVKAFNFINLIDPWQFVNIVETAKDELIDLSGGGLHHSWEEDKLLPLGNIVYEVQEDVTDNESTLRSFDQGKIKDDGTIRPISIDDYFRHLDTSPVRNKVQNARVIPNGESLLKTRHYSLDKLICKTKRKIPLLYSFHHLFVLDGAATIGKSPNTVRLTKGHSCLIPFVLGEYEIIPETPSATLLKTYIEKE